MQRSITGFVAALIALFTANTANAYTYTYSQTCVTTYQLGSGYVRSCSSSSLTPTSSSVAITPAVMRVAVNQTVDLLSNRLARFAVRSEAAKAQKLNIWVAGAHSNLNEGALADGGISTWMAGADYAVNDRLLTGISLGLEDSDIATGFNSGHYEGNGLTVAPYARYLIDDNFSVDGAFGYTNLDLDLLRGAGTISSSVDGDRWFGYVSGNYDTVVDAWRLGGSAGYLYAVESHDSFIESNGTPYASDNFYLGEFRFRTRAGYRIGQFEPFAALTYRYDNILSGHEVLDLDRQGLALAGGVDVFGNEWVDAGLQASHELLRDEESWSWLASVRIKF